MRRAASLANRLPVPVRRFLKRLPGAGPAKDSLAGHPKGAPPPTGALRPVVYLPTWARWDEMRQRPQFVIDAFAKLGHDAYFVDPREPRARRAGAVMIVPSLEDTPRSGVILYTHFAPLHTLFDRYEDAVVIYDILDDLTIYDADEVGMPEHRRVRFHHPAAMERADVVTASAPALVDAHIAEREDIIFVENGVDPDAFSLPTERPSDMPPGIGPVVGYHGMIARWFDFDLLGSVAAQLPDVAFVLVGPVDPSVRESLGVLCALPNVHHLGPRPSDVIASYVREFDVGIVPFVVDELTRAVSPLKMYEYMAAGVPVVASPLPVAEAHGLVETAADPVEFADRIRSMLSRADDAAFVHELTTAGSDAAWERRLGPVIDRLDRDGLRRARS